MSSCTEAASGSGAGQAISRSGFTGRSDNEDSELPKGRVVAVIENRAKEVSFHTELQAFAAV